MQLKRLKFLRTFIFLLVAVFLTDTVYASGMMIAAQVPISNSTVIEHCLDHGVVDADHHKHEAGTQQKQASDDHCSKCTHCMACFTVLPPSQLNNLESQVQEISTSLFKASYLSHVSAQLQRPPIS